MCAIKLTQIIPEERHSPLHRIYILFLQWRTTTYLQQLLGKLIKIGLFGGIQVLLRFQIKIGNLKQEIASVAPILTSDNHLKIASAEFLCLS